MRFKNCKIAFVLMGLLLLFAFQVSFAAYNEPTKLEEIKVYIDGDQYLPQQSFYSLRYNTLAPMREFFEKLGATVEWDEESRTVVARVKGDMLTINIDTKNIEFNGRLLEQKVQPQVINDSTYVPLRLIAESFGYEVDWNNVDKIITLADLSEIRANKSFDSYISSSHFKDEYLTMEIEDGKKLKVSGTTAEYQSGWLFMLEQVEKDKGKSKRKEIIKDFRSTNGKKFKSTFSLKNKLEDGEYEVIIYFQDKPRELYWTKYDGIIIKKEDDEIFFPQPLVYADNYFHQLKTAVINPNNYLDLNFKPEDRERLEKLAAEIIANERDDYKKVMKINDWISENIYYNLDGYYKGEYGRTDAIGTLDEKRSVCQGYAELTQALLRVSGIPCRLVNGNALGLGSNGRTWTDYSKEEMSASNHAWNEVYVDGRWIILDTTWNTHNEYKDGKFKEGIHHYRYFDPDLRAFSVDHKIFD